MEKEMLEIRLCPLCGSKATLRISKRKYNDKYQFYAVIECNRTNCPLIYNYAISHREKNPYPNMESIRFAVYFWGNRSREAYYSHFEQEMPDLHDFD
jgi:hypothetical protein